MINLSREKKIKFNNIYEEIYKKDIGLPGQSDFNILGKGGTRFAIEVEIESEKDNYWTSKNKYCLKVPFMRRGLFQNRKEMNNWYNNFKENTKQFLLPVLQKENEGKWILMPKCQKNKNKNVEEFKNRIKSKVEDDIDLMDIENDNVMAYKNKLYITDYGLLHKKI